MEARPLTHADTVRQIVANPKAVKRIPMVKYDRSPAHDILVVNAYAMMVDEGTIFNVLPAGTLSALFHALSPPSDVYFKQTPNGQIWFLGWFEHNEILGRLCALWIARDHRQSKESLVAVVELLDVGLSTYGEITAVTSQKKVVDGAVALGYNLVGKIQRRQGDRWIVYLRSDPTGAN